MPRLKREHWILLLLLALALVFFLDQANLVLASDDVAWLQGEAPTVFDQYRHIPRLFFVALHALAGPSAVAALAMIFLFHALNGLLVYALGEKLLAEPAAGLVAAAVFLINPLTLNTLTWISCFSYVLGTTLALLALLAFWKAVPAPAGRRSAASLLWELGALACFGAGLFCSHEIFFLPLVFLVLGWLRGAFGRGALLCAVGMGLALLVNALVYDFGRYGVEAARLFSPDFSLAYASSALSSGLALALAYPLSFFAHPLDFLRLCFAEPLRWGMTAVLLAAGILPPGAGKGWRLNLGLVAAFVALVTPYVIRLYLTPDSVNYHISYALSGRVFYLPFVALALSLGRLVSWLCRPIRGRRWAWLVWLAPLAAYVHALGLYDRTDFLGLSVALEALPEPLPPRWNPYTSQHLAWLLLPGLVVLLIFAARVLLTRQSQAQLPGSDSA